MEQNHPPESPLAKELAGIEFAENPDPRCPCLLLLDTSGSMNGPRLQGLQQGLQAFRDDLLKDTLASRRVEIAIVTFGSSARVVRDFGTMDQVEMPELTAEGLTPMAEGVLLALDLLERRKAEYKTNGIGYFRPWLFLITDGVATDPEPLQTRAKAELREAESRNRLSVFLVGVEGVDMDLLKTWAARHPLALKGLQFQEMFVWLSKSTQGVAKSQIGDQVALPPPTWGTV